MNDFIVPKEVNYIDKMIMKCCSTIIGIKKKSGAKMFKNAIVGDTIEFSIPIMPTGRSRRGAYAANLQCKNLRTEEISKKLTLNTSPKTLDCFEWDGGE